MAKKEIDLERINSVYGKGVELSEEELLTIGKLNRKGYRATIVALICGTLCFIDSFIPDPIPLIDETILAAATIISGILITKYIGTIEDFVNSKKHELNKKATIDLEK